MFQRLKSFWQEFCGTMSLLFESPRIPRKPSDHPPVLDRVPILLNHDPSKQIGVHHDSKADQERLAKFLKDRPPLTYAQLRDIDSKRARAAIRRDMAEKFFIASLQFEGHSMKHAALAERAVRDADSLLAALDSPK